MYQFQTLVFVFYLYGTALFFNSSIRRCKHFETKTKTRYRLHDSPEFVNQCALRLMT